MRVVILASPPITGKTTVVPWVVSYLPSSDGRPWIYLDNEWSFSKKMRVLAAEQSDLQLNSKEFARSFNLQGQLDYQALARRLADQNFNVIVPGPFEDLTTVIDGLPLYRKLKEVDFADYRLDVVQLLLWPQTDVQLNSSNILGHPAMSEVEAEIQTRRQLRGRGNPVQQELDADKSSPEYYSRRAKMILETNEMFPDEIELVKAYIDDEPETIGRRIARAIENSHSV